MYDVKGKKAVIVATPYGDDGNGAGTGAATYETAHCLKEAGVAVTVVSTTWAKNPHTRTDDGIPVHCQIPPLTLREKWINARHRFSPETIGPRTGRFISTGVALNHMIRALPFTPDWIEFPEGTLEAWPYLKNPTAQTVVKIHGNMNHHAHLQGLPQNQVLDKYLHLIYQKAHVLTCPSEQTRQELLSYLPAQARLGPALRNPISQKTLARFLPPKPTTPHMKVVWASRFESIKGADVLIETAPEILDLDDRLSLHLLDIVGQASANQTYKEKLLEKLTPAQKDRVYFFKPMTRFALMDFLRDALVLLSPSKWESFGYACLDALVCGCPVVGTHQGAQGQMIQNGTNGLLIKPDDASGLFSAISNIQKDPMAFRPDAQTIQTQLTPWQMPGFLEDYEKVMAQVFQ